MTPADLITEARKLVQSLAFAAPEMLEMHALRALEDAYAAGVRAERERAARRVEALPVPDSGYGTGGSPWGEAAAAIRAGE